MNQINIIIDRLHGLDRGSCSYYSTFSNKKIFCWWKMQNSKRPFKLNRRCDRGKFWDWKINSKKNGGIWM